MKKINRSYIYPLILLLAFFLLFWFLYIIKSKKIQEKIAYYNKSVSFSLDSYLSENDYHLDITTKLIKTGEIIDFNAKNSWKWNEENSKVEFLFSNNIMTIIADSIIKNKTEENKYFYITYLELFSKINDIKLSPKIFDTIPYLWIVLFEEDFYKFDKEKIVNLPMKYFLLSQFSKNWYTEGEKLKEKIYNDLLSNFDDLQYKEQIELFFLLSFSWELEIFLKDKNLNFTDISILVDYKGYYLYILNKLDPTNELVENLSKNIKENFDNISEEQKIAFLWYLSDTQDEDFNKYYLKIEEKNNYDLTLHQQFIKFLMYSKFENKYDNYAKFWYSSWLMQNRRKQFILNKEKPYYFEEFPLDKIIYDGIIDTRVSSFSWEDFYINVTVKQK